MVFLVVFSFVFVFRYKENQTKTQRYILKVHKKENTRTYFSRTTLVALFFIYLSEINMYRAIFVKLFLNKQHMVHQTFKHMGNLSQEVVMQYLIRWRVFH